MTEEQYRWLLQLTANDGSGGRLWKTSATVTVPGTVSVDEATGTACTFTSTAAVASSSVSAGAKSVSAVFSSDFSGTFNGIARDASTSVNIGAPLGKTLPAIAYTRTTGTIYIDVIT